MAGREWTGLERLGWAWCGKAGMDRPGKPCFGRVRYVTAGTVQVRRGADRTGREERGLAW